MDECIMTLALGLRDSEVDDGTVDAWRALPVPTHARPTTNWFGLLDQVGWVQDWVQTPETVGVTGFDAGEALPTPTDCVRIDQFSPPFPSGQAENHWYRGGVLFNPPPTRHFKKTLCITGTRLQFTLPKSPFKKNKKINHRNKND